MSWTSWEVLVINDVSALLLFFCAVSSLALCPCQLPVRILRHSKGVMVNFSWPWRDWTMVALTMSTLFIGSSHQSTYGRNKYWLIRDKGNNFWNLKLLSCLLPFLVHDSVVAVFCESFSSQPEQMKRNALHTKVVHNLYRRQVYFLSPVFGCNFPNSCMMFLLMLSVFTRCLLIIS